MADEFDGWIRGEALREGGQAWTYLAHKEGDGTRTPFVLKVLKHKSNPARLKRFQREIEVGARLRHPNLVHVEAENITSDKPYVVMEYCAGGDLRNLDLSNASLVDRLRLFKEICDGVGYMHENGAIHRDLKPNNIFLREDKRTPVVGDLGLCLIMEQEERLTEMTEAVGARLFMAPEMEDGRFEDAQPVADIYSLGKILYWLVSNKVIFSREKHRDEKYDLTRSDKTAAMAFVYHLLNGTITTTPSERQYSDATRLALAVQEIIERIAVMAHAIDPSVPQGCAYCGVGTYQTILDGNSRSPGFEQKIYHLGIKINSQDFHRWLILACDYCGNIQFFRGDVATKNPKAWMKGSGI